MRKRITSNQAFFLSLQNINIKGCSIAVDLELPLMGILQLLSAKQREIFSFHSQQVRLCQLPKCPDQ